MASPNVFEYFGSGFKDWHPHTAARVEDMAHDPLIRNKQPFPPTWLELVGIFPDSQPDIWAVSLAAGAVALERVLETGTDINKTSLCPAAVRKDFPKLPDRLQAFKVQLLPNGFEEIKDRSGNRMLGAHFQIGTSAMNIGLGLYDTVTRILYPVVPAQEVRRIAASEAPNLIAAPKPRYNA